MDQDQPRFGQSLYRIAEVLVFVLAVVGSAQGASYSTSGEKKIDQHAAMPAESDLQVSNGCPKIDMRNKGPWVLRFIHDPKTGIVLPCLSMN